jgi:hypothetical protein
MAVVEHLVLARTASTPAVDFNAKTGLLMLTGESYPENSFDFFRPLLDWVQAFLTETQGAVKLQIGLTYMNTSSIKSMMDLLDLLEDAHADSREVTVTWYYDEENDRALEMAEEFREEVTLPFFVLPIQHS